MKNHSFFASCPKNLELLVEQELLQLGATELKQTVAGVYFQATIAQAYRICLWSRLVNRVFLILTRASVQSIEELYAVAKNINWLEHMNATGTLAVDFNGRASFVNHTHFGALKIKDAIVDQCRERVGERPAIDVQRPDVRINAYLDNNELMISLDLSGNSLHQRGYRLAAGKAPLKENLAAAILLRANWPSIAKQGGTLIDPMCGSGTLLIEAAMQAADIAPGLLRDDFGFTRWLQHPAQVWHELQEEASLKRTMGLKNLQSQLLGYDIDARVIKVARQNIATAGLENHIKLGVQALSCLKKLPALPPGIIVVNPPYGERLSEEHELKSLYRQLGTKLKQEFLGWQAAVFTGNTELGKNMGLRALKQYAFFNGTIPCKLLLFSIEASMFVDETAGLKIRTLAPELWSNGAHMFANRLRKNNKLFAGWAKQNAIQCYRLYDADMPEYALAIDRYDSWLHVQEYAPPASIDPAKAKQRLREALSVIPEVLGVAVENIVVKQRQQQKGVAQYEKLAEEKHFIPVVEGAATLLVNLHDYLDTGLFLDHRPLRQKIYTLSQGKRFLNLFCYTATATVHAVLGGAITSVSVDMSNTYLNWAAENFTINNIDSQQHWLMQADCFDWLAKNSEKFDLILLDPPTFSNSKRMDDTLDIQRDHIKLIELTMRHLAPGGLLLFSTNFRKFKLNYAALANYKITEITPKTIDKDFIRNVKIHQCWEIQF